jgi:hypothetical protein
MTPATEWLFKQLWDTPKDKLTWYALLKEANEMHEQQTIDFTDNYILECLTCSYNGEPTSLKETEQYYNETYNIISGK